MLGGYLHFKSFKQGSPLGSYPREVSKSLTTGQTDRMILDLPELLQDGLRGELRAVTP